MKILLTFDLAGKSKLTAQKKLNCFLLAEMLSGCILFDGQFWSLELLLSGGVLDFIFSYFAQIIYFRKLCFLNLVKNYIKAEPHIRLFSENSRECWARIGKQEMCRLVYSYILGTRHYAPNTFLVLSNLRNSRILANTLCENQFSPLLVNLCEKARECRQIFSICLFSPILRELAYVQFCLWKKKRIFQGIDILFKNLLESECSPCSSQMAHVAL